MSNGRELTDWNPDSSNHHAYETILRICFATFGDHPCSVIFLQLRRHEQGNEEADPDGDKSQTNVTIIPTIVTAKDNWVAEEKCVLSQKLITRDVIIKMPGYTYEKTVDQSNVEGEQQKDGLSREHDYAELC